jgi:hypothetical protein
MHPVNHTIKLMIIEELEEAEKRGLWSNIRARRAAGKRRRKSNEKGYPKTLDIDETSNEVVESLLKVLIDKQIHDLDESVFDGSLGSGRPAPVDPEVRAAARAKELEISTKRAALAAKKTAAVINTVKPEVSKMDPKDQLDLIKNFGKEAPESPQQKTIAAPAGTKPTSAMATNTLPVGGSAPTKSPNDEKEASKKVVAAVLSLSKKDGTKAKELADAIKQNSKLRTAISTTPGMSDIDDVVDTNLRVAGKNPATAVGDSWRELGKVASRFGLAESIRQIIYEEIFSLNLKIKR